MDWAGELRLPGRGKGNDALDGMMSQQGIGSRRCFGLMRQPKHKGDPLRTLPKRNKKKDY